MTDVHGTEARSRNMRAIRSADTRPELYVRKALHASGLRYRLGGAGLPGRPDLVLPRHKTVIFVHGCFWHSHDCKYFKQPQTRSEFWLQKLAKNKARDSANITALLSLGWNVIVIWECVTRNKIDAPSKIAQKVQALLQLQSDLPTVSIIS